MVYSGWKRLVFCMITYLLYVPVPYTPPYSLTLCFRWRLPITLVRTISLHRSWHYLYTPYVAMQWCAGTPVLRPAKALRKEGYCFFPWRMPVPMLESSLDKSVPGIGSNSLTGYYKAYYTFIKSFHPHNRH